MTIELTKEQKLAKLLGAAITGRYTIRLDALAVDALEMIGEDLNVLSCALTPEGTGEVYVEDKRLHEMIAFAGMRASGIAELLHAASAGKLTLADDEGEAAPMRHTVERIEESPLEFVARITEEAKRVRVYPHHSRCAECQGKAEAKGH